MHGGLGRAGRVRPGRLSLNSTSMVFQSLNAFPEVIDVVHVIVLQCLLVELVEAVTPRKGGLDAGQELRSGYRLVSRR